MMLLRIRIALIMTTTICVLLFTNIFVIVGVAAAANPYPCQWIVVALAPCAAYIRGDVVSPPVDEPSELCCGGFRYVYNRVKFRQGRVYICKCIKHALSVVLYYDEKRIPLLPAKCAMPDVQLPPIDYYTKCSREITGKVYIDPSV